MNPRAEPPVRSIGTDPAAFSQFYRAHADEVTRFVARRVVGGLDGALISVGGSPPGTVAGTTDDAWRSAFESARSSRR